MFDSLESLSDQPLMSELQRYSTFLQYVCLSFMINKKQDIALCVLNAELSSFFYLSFGVFTCIWCFTDQ